MVGDYRQQELSTLTFNTRFFTACEAKPSLVHAAPTLSARPTVCYRLLRFSHPNNYSAPVGVRSIVINPSVCESGCPLAYPWNAIAAPTFTKFWIHTLAVARSSSGDVAILSVLWMTSSLAVWRNMEAEPLRDYHDSTSGVAIPGRSLMSMNACLNILYTRHAMNSCNI